MVDVKLGEIQKRALRYLLARADSDGLVNYEFDKLAEAAGSRNLYDIFRQFYMKDIIETMPHRVERGLFQVRLLDVDDLKAFLAIDGELTLPPEVSGSAGDIQNELVLKKEWVAKLLDEAIFQEVVRDDFPEGDVERLAELLKIKKGLDNLAELRIRIEKSA